MMRFPKGARVKRMPKSVADEIRKHYATASASEIKEINDAMDEFMDEVKAASIGTPRRMKDGSVIYQVDPKKMGLV